MVKMGGVRSRALALVLTLGLTLLAVVAQAQTPSYENALSGFAADSFGETEAAITGVAASGNPLAAQVIAALQDGRLLYDADSKKVYIKTTAGALLDAAGGQPAVGADAAKLQNVRINNRLRRALDASLGGLTLL